MNHRGALLICTSLALANARCGDPATMNTNPDGSTGPVTGSNEFVGRWGGQSMIDDLDITNGRAIRMDEVVEYGENGSMRADFSAIDDVTRCVVTYQLIGTYEVNGTALDARWSSIRSTTTGCADSSRNAPTTDVTAAEAAIWDTELDGTWSVDGSQFTITSGANVLSYTRIDNPLVARWVGQSTVDDLSFATGRSVALNEVFWVSNDGTLTAHVSGTDPETSCAVDYRLRGTWTATSAGQVDAQWTSIFAVVSDCSDASLDQEYGDVTADESALWADELDGLWSVSNDAMTIRNTAGGSIEYGRSL